MLNECDIDKYLDSIPPVSKIVKETLLNLKNSDMVQAANIAKNDKVFSNYLSQIVNKPIFGFRDEITNLNQIFGILGLSRARQVVSSYYLHIILPQEWEVLNFSNKKFQDLQANLITQWNLILDELGIKDSNLQQSIVLIPAALIVCEMLLKEIGSTVKLLKETKDISFDEILYKMSGQRLMDIVEKIALKWEFDEDIISLIRGFSQDAKGVRTKKEIIFLRLLISHEMSKPYAIESGLNDFFHFPLDFEEKDIMQFYSMLKMGQ